MNKNKNKNKERKEYIYRKHIYSLKKNGLQKTQVQTRGSGGGEPTAIGRTQKTRKYRCATYSELQPPWTKRRTALV